MRLLRAHDQQGRLAAVNAWQSSRLTIACTWRLSMLLGCGQCQEWRAFARIDCTPATCFGNLKRACWSWWAASEAKTVRQAATQICDISEMSE